MRYEPDRDDLRVMNSLIHPDTIPTIMAESGLSKKVSIDIVRNLHHYGFIRAMNSEDRPMASFDVDKIERVKFSLTAKGISFWEANSAKLK